MLSPRWKPRTCVRCSRLFPPKREAQRFCSHSCRSAASVTRLRAGRSTNISPPAIVAPKKRLQALTPQRGATCAPTQANPEAVESYGWGKPGDPPLQGDDYRLEYHEDGYPKLPPCLGRRIKEATVMDEALNAEANEAEAAAGLFFPISVSLLRERRPRDVDGSRNCTD